MTHFLLSAAVTAIVVGNEFYTNSNFADSLYNEDAHFTYPSKDLNAKIIEASKKLNKNTMVGPIITMDVFGPYASKEAQIENRPKNIDALAEEMEGFALVYIANKLEKDATCIATVVDSPFKDTVVTPEDREKSLNDMITIALEAIIK